jgi:MFS family permease
VTALAVRRQLGLLARATEFRLLFLSTFASGLGTWLAVIALTVDVYDRTHSAKWVSALLIVDFLPAVAMGLFFSAAIDQISRKLLMVGADVVRFGVFAVLPLATSASGIVALAALAGLATGFFRPAVFAGLPNLVEHDDLPNANSLLRAIEQVTVTVGTLLGGIAVAAQGPHLAYGVNAASFAISAIFLLGIPATALQAAPAASRGRLRDIGDGFAVVRASRALLTVFVVWNLMGLSNGAVNVAEVALAKVSFNSGDLGFALMWTASGIGSMLGSFGTPHVLERRGATFAYVGAIGLMSLGVAVAAVSPDVWVALPFFVLLGVGNGAALVCNTLLVQRGAPDAVRGRAFSIVMSVTYASLGLGMIVGGPLTDAIGARWVYAVAAVVSAAAALCSRALVRGASEESAPEPVPA